MIFWKVVCTSFIKFIIIQKQVSFKTSYFWLIGFASSRVATNNTAMAIMRWRRRHNHVIRGTARNLLQVREHMQSKWIERQYHSNVRLFVRTVALLSREPVWKEAKACIALPSRIRPLWVKRITKQEQERNTVLPQQHPNINKSKQTLCHNITSFLYNLQRRTTTTTTSSKLYNQTRKKDN